MTMRFFRFTRPGIAGVIPSLRSELRKELLS
jgi:hypothetical protein